MDIDNDSPRDTLDYKLEPLTTLEGHSDRVWHLAWNPVQHLLASCSADKSVRMWTYSRNKVDEDELMEDKEDYSFLPATEIPTGHRKTVRSIAWSPSGKSLATASFDTSVSIWERVPGDDDEEDDPGEWECVGTLEGHDSECKSVAYSNDGSLIATCSRDKSVWIWEVQPDAEFECLSVMLDSHTQDVKCVVWHPQEELLASASYDDTIQLYVDDPSDDWRPFATLAGHTSTVWHLAFSPCGSLLASVSDDLSMRIWQRYPKPPAVGPNQLVRVGGGSIAAEGEWRIALVIPDAHERSIYSVSWTKAPPNLTSTGTGASVEGDKGLIATGGADGRIKIWQIKVDDERNVSHKLIAEVENAHGVTDVNCVTWSPLEPGLLASAGDDCLSRVWRVSPTHPP